MMTSTSSALTERGLILTNKLISNVLNNFLSHLNNFQKNGDGQREISVRKVRIFGLCCGALSAFVSIFMLCICYAMLAEM